MGQLLKYMLHELTAKRLKKASVSLIGSLVKLQEELEQRHISTDAEDWWKQLVKPIIPKSVSPSKRDVPLHQELVNHGHNVLTAVSLDIINN